MATNKSSGIASAYRVFIGLAPHELPLSITRSYDFSGGASWIEDLGSAQENGQIEWVQAVYVDNSLNAQSVSLYCPITNQTITVGANKQAYLPVLAVNPPKFVVNSTGNVVVNISYLNFAVSAIVF